MTILRRIDSYLFCFVSSNTKWNVNVFWFTPFNEWLSSAIEGVELYFIFFYANHSALVWRRKNNWYNWLLFWMSAFMIHFEWIDRSVEYHKMQTDSNWKFVALLLIGIKYCNSVRNWTCLQYPPILKEELQFL